MTPLRVVALLRGVNVTGHNRVPMAALQALCARLGGRDVATYVQSGNVVFTGPSDDLAGLEAALEAGLRDDLGVSVAVMVRKAAQWEAYVQGCPWRTEAEAAPTTVLLGVGKGPIAPGAAEVLTGRGGAGERVVSAGDALWVHYVAGVGRSKLQPVVVERAAGVAVTARNWRTVCALGAMLGGV